MCSTWDDPELETIGGKLEHSVLQLGPVHLSNEVGDMPGSAKPKPQSSQCSPPPASQASLEIEVPMEPIHNSMEMKIIARPHHPKPVRPLPQKRAWRWKTGQVLKSLARTPHPKP